MTKVNATLQTLLKSLVAHPAQYFRKNAKKQYNTSSLKVYVSVLSGGVLLCRMSKLNKIFFKNQASPDAAIDIRTTSKERAFIKFASVEINGQVCMTPHDFLDFILKQEPRYNRRKVLNKRDMEEIVKSAVVLKPETPRILGTLGDKGIISYSEFLFLFSILTKPESGFRIAFDMFDVDGNQTVDKKEFMVMEKVFSQAWKRKRRLEKPNLKGVLVNDELDLQRNEQVNTTLLIYFFGPNGTKTLNFDIFKTFMVNLQTEILEAEFNEFSRGLPTISESDFAVIILRYTQLDENQKAKYLHRLANRINENQGITFDEFCAFGKFLKNLDDFNVALKMYTLAGRPITKTDFLRAAKICIGADLSVRVVDTVFALFDDDYGDGLLSYGEFIAIMKNRITLSYNSQEKNTSEWKAFKKCVSREMK